MSFLSLKYQRPKIILSRCLRGDKVRYNAELLENSLFVELEPYVDLITVCPEVQMGMPVPRPPIQIHQSKNPILYQPSTGIDFSNSMAKLCTQLNYSDIDGFLLKARSPSCGVVDTPHYLKPPSDKLKPGPSDPGQGLFTYLMKQKHENVAFCDEDRFRKAIYRDWFLTSCFISALKRSATFKNLKPINELLTPNLSFKANLLKLWPQKLYRLYRNLTLKSNITYSLQFAKDPIAQLKNIHNWRTAVSREDFCRDVLPLIQPYPRKLISDS